jgi:RNA polymerase sigma factor (sigma-70 family)
VTDPVRARRNLADDASPTGASREDAPVDGRDADLGQPGRLVGGAAAFAAAFEAAYRTHYAALCRFAATIVDSRDGARDVVQQVFAQLWAHGAGWDQSGTRVADTRVAYLFRAVRHRALDAVKHARVVERWQRCRSAGPNVGDAGPAIDERVERDEQLANVYAAIAELPDRSRQVLILRWQAHLDYPDIACVLGIAPASAKMLHSRALDGLRRRLGSDFA